MLMLEPASILTLESFRRLPPIVHKGNPGLHHNGARPVRPTPQFRIGQRSMVDRTDFLYQSL